MTVDPTRGYAAWIIEHGYEATPETWHRWLEFCAVDSLHIKHALIDVFSAIEDRAP